MTHRTRRRCNVDTDLCDNGPVSSVAERPASAEEPAFPDLVGEAPPSPAGPIEPAELAELGKPPIVPLPRTAQMLRFSQRQIEYVFGARRRIGETFRMRTAMPGGPVVTSHPDHVRSLFTAKPELAPSLTGESPLRPILGTGSVLTSLGERHMRQRKLLLPPFHGEAIERYTEMITAATERELDRWPLNRPFALAPRMQAITLDVIMAGIFGIEGKPERGTPEDRMRSTVKRLVNASTSPVGQAGELLGIGREDASGVIKLGVAMLDRPTYAVIRARRADEGLAERRDILSLLLQARTEDGETMDDKEVRDELLTLVLAGHETTANSLAWAWERLVRNPEAHEALREATRNGDNAEEQVEATIIESMRSRPVVPFIGRRVTVPWRFGPYGVSGRHSGRDEHPPRPPPRGPLPGAVRVPARALARPQTRHLRVDPLRRRHPPLPRRRPGDGRDAGGAGGDGPPPRSRGGRAKARARPAPQRNDDPRPRRPRHPARTSLAVLRRRR